MPDTGGNRQNHLIADEPILSSPQGFSGVLSSALIIFLGAMTARGLEFITRTIMAKYLGAADFGVISASIGVLAIVGTIVLIGLPLGLVHFIGTLEEPNRDRIPNLIFAALWYVVLIGGGLAIFAWWFDSKIAYGIFNDTNMSSVVRVLGLSLPLFSILAIISAVFQALKDVKGYVLVNNVALPILRLLGVVTAVLIGRGMLGVMNGYFVGALITSIFLAVLLLRHHSIPFISLQRVSVQDINLLLTFSAPLLIGSLLGRTVWTLDIILLQRLSNSTAAGLYAVVLNLSKLPNIILLSLGFILAPSMARKYNEGHLTEMRKLYSQTTETIFIVSLPIVAIFLLYASPLLSLFGNEYIEATNIMKLMAVGYFIHNLLGPNGNTLVMMGRSRLFMIGSLLAASIAVLFYILLIPRYGMTGATIATLAGLSVLNIYFSGSLYRLAGINPFIRFRWRLILVIFIASGITYSLSRAINLNLSISISLVITIALLVILYFLFALLFGGIHISEIKKITQMILVRSA